MRIQLLTQEQYDELLQLYTAYPELTFQNKGYEYINTSKLSSDALKAIESVNNILRECVDGFRKFNNFKLNTAGEIQVRLQYNYNYEGGGLPFTGVEYVLLNELLNGFTDQSHSNQGDNEDIPNPL